MESIFIHRSHEIRIFDAFFDEKMVLCSEIHCIIEFTPKIKVRELIT